MTSKPLSDGDIERMIDNLSHGMHPKVGDRIDIKSALTELQSLRAASVCVETLETLHKTEVDSFREREARLVEALEGLIAGVTAEVNEKGGGGYILARLTDARSALTSQGGRQDG